MVKRQRKKNRDKKRAERTGASRASAATGNVHRHDPVPDMTMLKDLPYAAGQPLNLDVAGRLVAACRARCLPCQETIARTVIDRHRPTLAALAGAVYGLPLNEATARSPHVSAATRSWAPLARAAAETSDGTAAYTAVAEMGDAYARELLDDALDHWAIGGADLDEIASMIKVVRDAPPRQRPADPTEALRAAGINVLTLDDLDLGDDIDPYHLAPNYGVTLMKTTTPDGQELPMLVLYPETEDAGIEDLERRTDWEHWGLHGMPDTDPDWRVRARIADRSLQGLVHVGPDGEDDIELWRATETVTLPAHWWDLLDRAQHVLIAGPVKTPEDSQALQATGDAGELLAVVARVSFA